MKFKGLILVLLILVTAFLTHGFTPVISLNEGLAKNDTVNQYTEHGERTGYWCGYFSNGNLRYEGYFENGKPLGRFIYYFPAGRKRAELIHVPDEEAVQATFYHRRGRNVMAEGQYVDRKKHGLWRLFNERGILIMENYFHMDENHGVWKTFDTSGDLIEIATFHYGVKQGEFTKYYGNGNKRIHANYHNDKLNGEFRTFHPNGRTMAEGYYYNNLPHKRWTHVAWNGEIEKIIVYDKGEIIQENIFIEREEGYYQDDDELRPFTDPYRDLFPGMF